MKTCGSDGIRTHAAGTFETNALTSAFDHSAILPLSFKVYGFLQAFATTKSIILGVNGVIEHYNN